MCVCVYKFDVRHVGMMVFGCCKVEPISSRDTAGQLRGCLLFVVYLLGQLNWAPTSEKYLCHMPHMPTGNTFFKCSARILQLWCVSGLSLYIDKCIYTCTVYTYIYLLAAFFSILLAYCSFVVGLRPESGSNALRHACQSFGRWLFQCGCDCWCVWMGVWVCFKATSSAQLD